MIIKGSCYTNEKCGASLTSIAANVTGMLGAISVTVFAIASGLLYLGASILSYHNSNGCGVIIKWWDIFTDPYPYSVKGKC